jgi:hypothetical protein
MPGGHNPALLIGNGLSIAFSDQVLLRNISQEMTDRFTSQYNRQRCGREGHAKRGKSSANW